MMYAWGVVAQTTNPYCRYIDSSYLGLFIAYGLHARTTTTANTPVVPHIPSTDKYYGHTLRQVYRYTGVIGKRKLSSAFCPPQRGMHEWSRAGRPGGVSGYPLAWYRSVSSNQVAPNAYSYKFVGLFLVHKLTCGKRESVSSQHRTKNKRAVELLNPVRHKNWRQEPEG